VKRESRKHKVPVRSRCLPATGPFQKHRATGFAAPPVLTLQGGVGGHTKWASPGAPPKNSSQPAPALALFLCLRRGVQLWYTRPIWASQTHTGLSMSHKYMAGRARCRTDRGRQASRHCRETCRGAALRGGPRSSRRPCASVHPSTTKYCGPRANPARSGGWAPARQTRQTVRRQVRENHGVEEPDALGNQRGQRDETWRSANRSRRRTRLPASARGQSAPAATVTSAR
jgi:hypothetical protein